METKDYKALEITIPTRLFCAEHDYSLIIVYSKDFDDCEVFMDLSGFSKNGENSSLCFRKVREGCYIPDYIKRFVSQTIDFEGNSIEQLLEFLKD